MPINVQSDLPAKKIMEEENIFMMDQIRAGSQDIRPLRIAILNLMPLKEDTEVHLPYMVVGNEVLQTVVIHLKQVVSVFFYMLQKQLASGVIQ